MPNFISNNAQAWTFGEPFANSKGGLMVEVSNEDGSKISGFMPDALKVPFGVEPGMEDKTRMSAQLMIPSRDSPIVAFFKNVDECIIKWIVANSERLFKKKMSVDLVRELFIPTIKIPENAGQKPLLRVKMNQAGKFPTKVIMKLNDEEYTTGDISQISSGSMVHVVLEVGCLWFISKRCGVSLIASKVMLEPGTAMKAISPSDFGVETPMRCVVATPVVAVGAASGAAATSFVDELVHAAADEEEDSRRGAKRKADEEPSDADNSHTKPKIF